MGRVIVDRIAGEVLAEAGIEPPACAYRLCLAAGLAVRVAPRRARACLVGSTVLVPPHDPPERQRFAAAHELAHLLLRERGLPDAERDADALAAALTLPTPWFCAQLERLGWDLLALRRICRYSSHEAIGRRIVSLGGAVLWVCDRARGKRHSTRWLSDDADPALAHPTPLEWQTVARVARERQAYRDERIGAWPLESPDVLRVISLARAEGLTPPPPPIATAFGA
jgi:hypothetical protein